MAALVMWEYASIIVGAIVLLTILKRILIKPRPLGPACLKCGAHHGVSMCMYCQGHYCQTHVFREAHHCQEFRRTASL